MKNNKGINLITLVIMIVIIIILAAIVIRPVTNSYDNAIKSRQEAERNQVVSAITERFGDNQRNNNLYPLIGEAIPNEYQNTEEALSGYLISLFKNKGKLLSKDEDEIQTQKSEIEKFVSDNFEDMEYTKILYGTELLSLDIETTTTNTIYLVNYYSSDVVGPIS